MASVNKNQAGFTLIEIAIVLLIVIILLGYTVAMFPIQQELKQYRSANAEMDRIIEHMIAFAQVNGRLPCPDTDGGDVNLTGVGGVLDGVEDFDDLVDNVTPPGVPDGLPDNCKAFFGFVPARTLGMSGKFDEDGTLLDPWLAGYGYAISEIDSDGNSSLDLISPNGIREAGIALVQPDLFLCDDSDTTGTDTDCTMVSGAEVMGTNGEVAAVVISLGRDNAIPATSNIQDENVDDFNDGTNDKVYILAPRRDDYDDIVKWISTNLLISRMIEADQLP